MIIPKKTCPLSFRQLLILMKGLWAKINQFSKSYMCLLRVVFHLSRKSPVSNIQHLLKTGFGQPVKANLKSFCLNWYSFQKVGAKKSYNSMFIVLMEIVYLFLLTSIRNPCHVRSKDIDAHLSWPNIYNCFDQLLTSTQCKFFENWKTLQQYCTIFVLNWICLMENIFILFKKIWFSHWTFIWIQTALSFKILNHFCKEKSFSSKPLFQ